MWPQVLTDVVAVLTPVIVALALPIFAFWICCVCTVHQSVTTVTH